MTDIGYLTACFLFLIRQHQHTPHVTANRATSIRIIPPPVHVATNMYRLECSFEPPPTVLSLVDPKIIAYAR